MGIAAHFEGPSQGQLATQVSMLNTLASTGATGYFISVIDPASEGAIINKAVAKGVAVAAIDSPVPSADAKTFTFIGTPNVTAGFAAGEAMKKALPNGGDVAILVGSLTATNVIQRTQGFMQAIKGSNIKVIATDNDNGVAATAATNASTVIATHPTLKGIYAEYSYEGPAAAVAVKTKGDIGKISVVADDNEPGTITGLQNGSIVASILQQPFMQGYLGAYVTAAIKVLGSGEGAGDHEAVRDRRRDQHRGRDADQGEPARRPRLQQGNWRRLARRRLTATRTPVTISYSPVSASCTGRPWCSTWTGWSCAEARSSASSVRTEPGNRR